MQTDWRLFIRPQMFSLFVVFMGSCRSAFISQPDTDQHPHRGFCGRKTETSESREECESSRGEFIHCLKTCARGKGVHALPWQLMIDCVVCGVTVRQSRGRAEENCVSWTDVWKQRKPQRLIGFNRRQIKGHNLVRFNNLNFLNHFWSPSSAFLGKVAERDLTYFSHACWWWTRSSCGVGSLSSPPDGSQACCLLLTLRLRQQVAPVLCSDTTSELL